MKESTKEWLGIKLANLVIYSGFLCLVPVYYSKSSIIDISFLFFGFILCITSCCLGMKPHPKLSKANNSIKLLAYPACTIFFLYLAYLNFSSWQ